MARMAVRERIKLEDAEGPQTPTSEVMRKLLTLAWRHKYAALPALLVTVAMELLILFGFFLQGLAVNEVTVAVGEDAQPTQWPLGVTPPEQWGTLDIVLALVGIIVAVNIIAGVCQFGQRVLRENFMQQTNIDLRTRLYSKLQALGFTFFDDHDTGQIIQRVTQDVSELRNFLEGVVISLIISGVTLSVYLVYMINHSIVLTIACMLTIPVQVWALIQYGRVAEPKFKEHGRLTDLVVQFYKECIEGVRVIRIFGREREVFGRFETRSVTARNFRIDLAYLSARVIPLLHSATLYNSAIMLGVGGWLVAQNFEAKAVVTSLRLAVDGSGLMAIDIINDALVNAAADAADEVGIALGTWWTFYLLMQRFGGQVEAIVSIAAQAPVALASGSRIFRLLDAEPDVDSFEDSRLPGGGLTGSVRFENVTFGYEPGVPVLHNVSFAVEPGETIAIVGPTGSGKSTLLSLVARFYDPDEGGVFIDGVDLRALPVHELRRRVGFVFQEPFLFSNTVRNNIAFGLPEAGLDDIRTATNAAAATNFIDELDHGFDTVIGERGVSLSGGQRQRLTLARALLLRPSILVLDDATGSVDAITEAHIQRELETYLGRRTTFVVAHRLSTLRRADRIIVMELGRIVDIGSHEELMNRPGHYHAAALIQLELDKHDEDEDNASHDDEGRP